MRSGFAVILVAIGAGCVERRISVDTEPQGVLVHLNNQEIGRTPVSRDFTFYGDVDVELRKEGYQTLKTSKWVVAPWWQWPPIDLFAELLPLRDDRAMSFTLNPASTEPADAVLLMDRAAEMRGKLESSPSTRKPTTVPTAP